MKSSNLPIEDVLPTLCETLRDNTRAVLVAPPGAGKTTRVPLVLSDAAWLAGQRIVMLEPRRLAARTAAERLAANSGGKVGGRVGLKARMVSRVSRETQIEVVTEGVFARMILDQPDLSGIGLVIFDEYHERSLDADFGLALALDAQAGLREELRILVMSATLDGARVAGMLGDCPVVESAGQAYPVATTYLGRDPAAPLERQVARAVGQALRETRGDILVFLPGQGEIRRCETLLAETPSADTLVTPLYGAMAPADQDRAISPAAPGVRKIILATAIAETSLTIDGVTCVIDSGLAREPRYDVGARMTRLATVRVSRASADQRRGRAGRLGPGHCYRLWAEPETDSLLAHSTPEILSSDLTGLVLDCAHWGVAHPSDLIWLDPPPNAGVDAAIADLTALDALDARGRLTEFGTALRSLPVPPHLAAMICRAAEHGQSHDAAELAALLVERGLGGNDADLDLRLQRFRSDKSGRAKGMRRLAERWAQAAEETIGRTTNNGAPLSTAGLLALAYPDRIAMARGTDGRYLMAGGAGAQLPPEESLSRSRYLVVAESQGAARAGRITAAAALDDAELEIVARDRIHSDIVVSFDVQSRSVRARRERRLGAIRLASEPIPPPEGPETAACLCEGIATIGVAALPWSKSQGALRQRVGFLRAGSPDSWPDLSDAALGQSVEDWLGPFLGNKTSIAQVSADDLGSALDILLPWTARQHVETQAPSHFTAPTGNRHPIEYDGEQAPSVSLRVQELFGLTMHPAIDQGRLPLTLVLLSPAQRPIQVTRDLPGFWAGSWTDVRADLRGRYPKHDWPEDPANATPTARAKSRRK